MDAMAYMFSVAREDSSSVLEFKPECIMEEDLMSLSSKFPLIPGSQRSITFCTTLLSQKLREMPSDADFDLTDPYNTPPRYNVLHDPHLKEYFQNPAMRKRMIEKGFITPSGFVKCTLLEFNMFRQWIRKLKLDRIHQERRRQRQIEKQQWKEKQEREQLLRDEELYSIVREREQKARELKERGIKRREADRKKYLKLQEIDRKRREKFEEEKRRTKHMKESHREKAIAKKQAEKIEEEEKVRKIKIRLLVKRSSEDKRRESLLEKRRQTLNEEREEKLKETWKRRCSLSLERQEEKRIQEEKEREEHVRNVARRTSIVEQQRRKSRVYHDLCLQRRRDTLEKQHQEAENFLEKMREKKIKDLELWKQKHQRLRERHLQQGRRISLRNKPGDRRRSRLSSVWDLQSSLKNEFGIDDNVVYSGVVFAGRKATQRARQLKTLAEEETSRQMEEVDEFEKLLSRLEAEFALRERVHYVVFGIISNAQRVLDIQERLEMGKDVPGYVQRIVDAAQRILADEQTSESDARCQVRKYILRVINDVGASFESCRVLLSPNEERQRVAQQIVANAISNAKEEFKRRVSLHDTAPEIVTVGPEKDKVAEAISENLFECARDIVTVAIMSACRHNKDDRELTTARSLAADAVHAAKASLQKIYGTACKLDAKDQEDTDEISSSLDKCAKEVAAAAIISATRSLERTFSKDVNAMAARSLALDAVAAAKASLEVILGVEVEQEEEDLVPSMDLSACLAKSARDIAEAIVISSSRLREPTDERSNLESRVAQLLASDAIQAAVASIETLHGLKVDSEEQSDHIAMGIAATAVISVTQTKEKDSQKHDFDLAVAARELASSAMDSAKTSTSWLLSEKVASGSKQGTLRMFSCLEEAVKRIADVAVESATRSLQRMAEENERDLRYTTRELVTNVLDSAKASIEKLYGIKIDPEVELSLSSHELSPSSQELSPSSQELSPSSIVSSASDSLENIASVKGHQEELMIAARNLAADAVKATKASLERFYCMTNEMESTIENTAMDISNSLVDSSRNLRQRLGKEGLGTAARELACCAIESAAKSVAKLYGDKMSVQEIIGSDSRLLKAAAKVSTISVRASSGDLFDRGFIGSSELEEATCYMATHAVRSAEAVLEKVQESNTTVDLDLQICKVAFELASQAVVSAEDSVARLVQENVPVSSDLASEHGWLFWKVITYVEGLINAALRSLGSVGILNDTTNSLEDYEIISHNEASEADAEYSPHVQDLYQRERLALRASRMVNDVVENAKEIVKARMTNRSFFSVPDVRPGYARFTRRRSSSVHFNEGSLVHSRRDSYVANRPPTPRFRKARAESLGSEKIQELGKELSFPSGSDLKTFDVADSDSVQRRLSDPEQGINSEVVQEPERSASDSKLIVGDQGSPLTEKASLYDIIKKREEIASCEISPCGSYVVLPHLNPSECSLIAARVESYEVLWKQKKNTTSVTSLPLLSPKGSFVASEAAQQGLQPEESQNHTKPSSSRLPDIAGSTSKISKRSSSESSLKQSSRYPKRTLSLQLKVSPKPFPQKSKESAKVSSKPSVGKGSLVKVETSSRRSLGTRGESGQSSSGSEISVTQKSSVKFEHHSHLAHATRSGPGRSPTRSSLYARSSTETVTRSHTTIPQNKLKSPPKTSILFATTNSGKPPSDPSSDKAVKSLNVSADEMILAQSKSTEDVKHSSCVSNDNVVSPPCGSKTSSGNISSSPRSTSGTQLSTVIAGSVPPVSKEKAMQSRPTHSENALSSASVSSKGVVGQSSSASKENAVLYPNVSKRKMTQMPPSSAKKAEPSNSGSKTKITLSPRTSTEITVLSPRASQGKVIHSPRTSANKAVLSPRPFKGKVTQSQRVSPENAGLTPPVCDNDVAPSPRASTLNAALSSSFSKGKVTQSSNASAHEKVTSTDTTFARSQTSDVSTEPRSVEVPTVNTAVIFPKTVETISSSSESSMNPQEDIKKTEKAAMAVKELTLSGENQEKNLSCSTTKLGKSSENEIVEKNLAAVHPTSLQTYVSQEEGVGSELDGTDGYSHETKESGINRNSKNVVPSLERIIQDKRLTPEGAEAETRPASSADVLASRKSTDPEGLKRNSTVRQAISRSDRSSLSKSLSSTASSPAGVTVDQQGSRSSQKVALPKASGENEVAPSRKKPEGEDRAEVHGVSLAATGKSLDKKIEKKESVSKMLDSSLAEIASLPGGVKELIPTLRDVSKVKGYPTYRKVNVSRSIHDTVDDIVQRMLRTAEEPSAVEAVHSSGRASYEETKRGRKINCDAPDMTGRERAIPTSKVSKTVIDTVDLMLQSVSASDERKPRYSPGRKNSGSDILAGCDAPRTASSMERFARITSSALQGVSCVYGLSPAPPKLPSPKVSRLRTTSSQDSLGIRATQSDSSIVSSFSDKAADLKPKVSGAWLDNCENSSVRSQSPMRPQSSPSPSLHRRSSEKLSMRHSLEGISLEAHGTSRKIHS